MSVGAGPSLGGGLWMADTQNYQIAQEDPLAPLPICNCGNGNGGGSCGTGSGSSGSSSSAVDGTYAGQQVSLFTIPYGQRNDGLMPLSTLCLPPCCPGCCTSCGPPPVQTGPYCLMGGTFNFSSDAVAPLVLMCPETGYGVVTSCSSPDAGLYLFLFVDDGLKHLMTPGGWAQACDNVFQQYDSGEQSGTPGTYPYCGNNLIVNVD